MPRIALFCSILQSDDNQSINQSCLQSESAILQTKPSLKIKFDTEHVFLQQIQITVLMAASVYAADNDMSEAGWAYW